MSSDIILTFTVNNLEYGHDNNAKWKYVRACAGCFSCYRVVNAVYNKLYCKDKDVKWYSR